MFEQATRQKLRFDTVRGEITTEQLWELPLLSKSGFDLDSVAKSVNGELKAINEESFVETRTNPRKAQLELKLEIVKRVIAVKQEENAAAANAVAKREERQKLEAILATKQAAKLEGLSEEEIQKRLDELNA